MHLFPIFLCRTLDPPLILNPWTTTGLRTYTSPSLTVISTTIGCHHSFARPLKRCRVRATQTRMRSLQTTMAMYWPSTATRNTSAFLDPSSRGTTQATPQPRSPLTSGESPVPGPDPGPTPDPGPIPERMGPYQREAPVGPPA